MGYRKAEAKDIVEGNTVLLIGDGNFPYEMVIDEVLRPNDPWKAFDADDGCRYGLEGLYVREESDSSPSSIIPQVPYECPSCVGTGKVLNTKYNCMTSDIYEVECRTCNGEGLIWR